MQFVEVFGQNTSPAHFASVSIFTHKENNSIFASDGVRLDPKTIDNNQNPSVNFPSPLSRRNDQTTSNQTKNKQINNN